MSLATNLKEFTDLLSDISTNRGFIDNFPKDVLLQQLFYFSFKALGSGIVYLLTFQWLRDFSYLPLVAPEINTASLFGENWLDSPTSHLFSFTSIPKQATDELIAGFINSFFFSLPFSLPHLISIRRLLSQGTVAAAASVLGVIGAHSLFLIAVIYGLRFLIVPYFALESLNYVIAILVTAVIIKEMVQQKGIKIVPLSDTTSLLKIFLSTFLLTWCEETTVFHTFKNLTLNAQNTYLDLYPFTSGLYWFITHTTYFLAFLVGNCVFSILFYYLILTSVEFIRSLTGFTYPKMVRLLNKVLICGIVAFSLSSLPYYGLDYIFTRIAGFLPEDTIYKNTVFSPNLIKTKFPHFFKEMPPAERNAKTPLALDVNYFDRGLYLNTLKDVTTNKDDPQSLPLSFEELNYQDEYAWILRSDAEKTLTKKRNSAFSPMFKKSRDRYAILRAKADERQAEADRKANQKIVPGKIAQSKEGILPTEKAPVFIKIPDFLGTTFSLPSQVEREMQPFDLDNTQAVLQKNKSIEFSGNNKGSFMTPHPRGLQEQEATDFTLISPHVHDDAFAPQKQSVVREAGKDKKIDPLQEELQFEQQVSSNFSKGFASPIDFVYERARLQFLPIKNIIKRKYFFNPVYRGLLQTDIDNFLARQPATYKLAPNQEYHLFNKRKVLQRYYNWLRYYQPFEKMIQLRYQIPDSKSFVDRVYHQQFKGTLKITRRLFKVSFDEQINPDKTGILSYDQLLYNDLNEQENPFLHEELLDTRLKNTTSQENWLEKLEFNNYINAEKSNSPEKSPFIEESHSPPIYAAWDSEKRGFVVTNRFTVKHID